MQTNRIYLFAFVYILFSFKLLADDSLQHLLNAKQKAIITTDTVQIIDSYKYLGDYLSELGDYKKSDYYLQIAVNIARKANEKNESGILYNLLATNASYQGDRSLALTYYHYALKAFTEVKNIDKVAMTLMNMGSEYEFMGNYRLATAYVLKAIKNKEKSGIKKNLAYYYQHLGQLFKETDKGKWKFYVEKAYQISKNSSEERISTRAAIFNDLGGIAQHEKSYDVANAWYDSMIVISNANDYKNGLATAYSNRALVYKAQGKFDKALNDILKELEIAYEINRSYSKITGHTTAANVLIELNRANEARYHANKALELAVAEKSYPEEEAAAHLALATIGEKTKNWEMAYRHYCMYKDGLDSVKAADVQKSVHDLELKYRTVEKEKEIARLDNENELKNFTISRDRNLFIALILIILLAGVILLLLYIRKQLRFEKQQAELKQKLLRSQMNPHFVFNTLNAINQYIQTNKGNEASDYLARYAKLMRQILENSTKELIYLESEIEFINNYLLMQQLRFAGSFEFSILIDPAIDISGYEIPPMIAQPFIENAIEHGIRGLSGGMVKVEFKMKDNKLILMIADNGKGFHTGSGKMDHRSFAIDITRERLNLTGKKPDKILIESPDHITGKGTLVVIEIPYRFLSD